MVRRICRLELRDSENDVYDRTFFLFTLVKKEEVKKEMKVWNEFVGQREEGLNNLTPTPSALLMG